MQVLKKGHKYCEAFSSKFVNQLLIPSNNLSDEERIRSPHGHCFGIQ